MLCLSGSQLVGSIFRGSHLGSSTLSNGDDVGLCVDQLGTSVTASTHTLCCTRVYVIKYLFQLLQK